jgi:hypothetical protein
MSNPVFNDEVYYGYIPSDPEPDFSLQKEIHDMTAQEKQDTLEQFAKNQTDALMEDEQRRLNERHWRDDHHKRMIVAQERGDEYLADAIMQRGSAETGWIGAPLHGVFGVWKDLLFHSKNSMDIHGVLELQDSMEFLELHGYSR